MGTEPTLRYCVEYRWKKAPPPPYKNDWNQTWSFDELERAQEAKRDDEEDSPCWEFRIVDSHAEQVPA